MVNCKSYAIETSPAALKDAGTFAVMPVSDTEKRTLPVSDTEKRLPEVEPLVPILILKRSPVAVVALPGDQSNDASFPEVKPVEVVVTSRSVPELKVLALLDNCKSFPVVIDVEDI